MNFGGYTISQALYAWIKEFLPDGSTILELGSGEGTKALCQHYQVTSVEHDPNWLNKARTRYIYAPIVLDWYDPQVLQQYLPLEYDLLLIDGPPGYYNRKRFFNFRQLFRTDVPIVVDDVHRQNEQELVALLEGCGYYSERHEAGEKAFCVLFPNGDFEWDYEL